MPSDVVIVLTTWPADRDAATFAETLVVERLAACVNVLGEMQSTYSWKGNVERERERQIVMKTTAGRVEALKARLAELHPYEVPELLVVQVDDGGSAYLGWVAESVGA
ncbi:MAG: divalent-cation tolerance protein CutA [Bacteroidales bacterium]